MNLIKLSILFVLIAIPFMLISYMDTMALQKRAQAKWQYNRLTQNAVDDAAATIKGTAVVGGTDEGQLMVDAAGVVDGFLASYHHGFRAFSDQDKVRVDQHLLALLIMDYDGFYIYGIREVRDPLGNAVMAHVLSEKKPYTYEDGLHLIHVTLGQKLRLLEKGTLNEDEGVLGELSSLPGSVPLSHYEEWRDRVITASVSKALEETVSLHNRYGAALGLAYEFHMPLGDHSTLAQAIEGPGIVAFIQGHPLGGGQYLETMAFGQGSTTRASEVIGYQDASGDFYYCTDACSHAIADPEVKRFSSPLEAAREGYYPCHMLGK